MRHKTPYGWFPNGQFCQVRWPGLHLKGKRLPICKIVTEGRRYPRLVQPPLIQCAINVEEMGHHPLHREVHVAEFPK